MTLLVSLTTYILASLHSHTSHTSHISRITTLPHSSRLGIWETIYHLFHYTLLHSAEDKWTIPCSWTKRLNTREPLGAHVRSFEHVDPIRSRVRFWLGNLKNSFWLYRRVQTTKHVCPKVLSPSVLLLDSRSFVSKKASGFQVHHTQWMFNYVAISYLIWQIVTIAHDASISISARKSMCEPGWCKHKHKKKENISFSYTCACVAPVHTYFFLRLCLCLRRTCEPAFRWGKCSPF